MSFFAPDCVLEMPRGPEPWGTRFEGLAAVREGLRGRFTGTPAVHYGEATHTVDGDTGIREVLMAFLLDRRGGRPWRRQDLDVPCLCGELISPPHKR